MAKEKKEKKPVKKVEKQQTISIIIIVLLMALLGVATAYFIVRGNLVRESKDNNSNVRVIDVSK